MQRFAFFAGVFFLTAFMLAAELILVRIFSVTIWYHIGYVAITLALTGVAVGAFAYSRWQKNSTTLCGVLALCAAIFFALAVDIHLRISLAELSIYSWNLWWRILLQFSFFILPFFFVGWVLSSIISLKMTYLGELYAVDLLGAAAGSLITAILCSYIEVPVLIFAVCGLASLSAAFFFRTAQNNKSAVGALLLTVIFLLASFLNNFYNFTRVRWVKSYAKEEMQRQEEGLVYEKWGPISRISIYEPSIGWHKDKILIAKNDAGANFFLWKFDKETQRVKARYMYRLLPSLPVRVKKKAEALVIGSAGGGIVQSLLAWGVKSITAVEINPVIGDLVTNEFAEYIGAPFADPKVNLVIEEGRSFIQRTEKNFDVIVIAMVDSWVGGANASFVFRENFLYTKEAIKAYMSRLKKDGVLAISRYFHWHEAFKLQNLLINQLFDQGIKKPSDHIMVFVEPEELRGKFLRRALFLVKNEPFNHQEIENALKTKDSYFNQHLYLPNTPKANLLINGAKEKSIHAMLKAADGGRKTYGAFLKKLKIDHSLVSDDRPFFFFDKRIASATKAPIHKASVLAVRILVLITFVLLCAVAIAIYLGHRKKEISEVGMSATSYFFFTGCGYMLVQIPSIQIFSLLLGNPIHAFSIIISIFLFSSGIGSFIFSRIVKNKINSKMGIRTILLLLILGITFFLLGWLNIAKVFQLSFPFQLFLGVGVLFFTGIFMGMTFPLGSYSLGLLNKANFSYYFGINSLASILGPSLAFLISIYWGFSYSLLAGIIFYLLAMSALLLNEKTNKSMITYGKTL